MELCKKCNNIETTNKDRICTNCRRVYMDRFYRMRKTLGLCIRCHGKNNSDNLMCKVCTEKMLRIQSDRRMNNKKNFLCVVCSAKTNGINTECDNCRDQRNVKFSVKSEENRCNGLCGQCGKNIPKEGLVTCSACLEKSRKHYHLREKQVRQAKNKRIKSLVFDHYGGKCACCGENIEMLLNIDHINNDGNKHRKKIRNTSLIYKEIVCGGFPDTFQLLCWTCNMGKHLNGGICPHQEK